MVISTDIRYMYLEREGEKKSVYLHVFISRIDAAVFIVLTFNNAKNKKERRGKFGDFYNFAMRVGKMERGARSVTRSIFNWPIVRDFAICLQLCVWTLHRAISASYTRPRSSKTLAREKSTTGDPFEMRVDFETETRTCKIPA